MTPEEQQSVRKSLLIARTIFGLGGGLVGIVLGYAVGHHVLQATRTTDTPVVLVGASVDLDAPSQWNPDATSGTYYAQGGTPIVKISVRDPQDHEVVSIGTAGQPWQVTVTSDGGDGSSPNTVLVSQAATESNIHVAPINNTGSLTLSSGTRLHYHRRGMSCPPGSNNSCDKLMSVSITVGNITLGPINCTDGPGITGHCRVAFKNTQ